MITVQRFMTEICISLFYFVSASKSRSLLIANYSPILTKFKGNLIQMSLYGHLTTSHPHQKTNLFKRCAEQTESKENFCLITVYSHKTFFQPQAIRAKKQTFSNYFAPFPCEAGEGLGMGDKVTSRGQKERVWGRGFAPPTAFLRALSVSAVKML
jgi:hypothetical protein